MTQQTFIGNGSIQKIHSILEQIGSKKFMLVCGNSLFSLPIYSEIEAIKIPCVIFKEFSPNPKYEDICKGVALFKRERCDAIVAVGGGSPIDIAKCIKLYSTMDESRNYLEQTCCHSDVPLIAVPTTAGTGSEATPYAVIYYQGVKQSITHECILPDYAILEPRVLERLPLYQKKCTLLDALCQALESWWSVKSNEESKASAKRATEAIVRHYRAYLEGDPHALEPIMIASNDAGKAIYHTATTAPHAMSYKLTTTYGFPHGHSVALCFPKVWAYMLRHMDQCSDCRGRAYLQQIFEEMAKSLGCNTPEEAVIFFESLLKQLEISSPVAHDREQELDQLTQDINLERLNKTPVSFTSEAIKSIYEQILQ